MSELYKDFINSKSDQVINTLGGTITPAPSSPELYRDFLGRKFDDVINAISSGGGGSSILDPYILAEKIANWDFTNSLIDTVNGYQAVLNNANQDSYGVHLTALDSYVKLFDTLPYKKGTVIEITIGDVDPIFNTDKHGAILTYTSLSSNTVEGFMYRNTGRFGYYAATSGSSGTWLVSNISDSSYIADKTIKIGFRNSNSIIVAVDDVILFQATYSDRTSLYNVVLGIANVSGNNNSYYDLTVKSVVINNIQTLI